MHAPTVKKSSELSTEFFTTLLFTDERQMSLGTVSTISTLPGTLYNWVLLVLAEHRQLASQPTRNGGVDADVLALLDIFRAWERDFLEIERFW